MKKLNTSIGLFALALIFFGAVLLNNLLLNPYRIDLTENKVFSLSEGSKAVLKKIDEPVNLYFFFSEKTSEGLTQIRSYAERVKNLLEEYQLHSNGKIKLHVIDPEPFSENEDMAAEFGLTAAPVGNLGDNLYFGLGGRNALDDQEIIAFFDPSKEEFLEYDISKLINSLVDPNAIKVSIITDLPIAGGSDPAMMNPMMMNQAQQPWVFYQQLQQLYETEVLAADASEIPAQTDVLMLINPTEPSDALKYSIDQFIMQGGNVLAFIDPHTESSPAGVSQQSGLQAFLDTWGVEFDASQIVLDASAALEIRMPSGGSGKHFAYLGLNRQLISEKDTVTGQLESINGASFGYLAKKQDADINFEPLFESSPYTNTTNSMLYSSMRDPQRLQQNFVPDNQTKVLAARISGQLTSVFKDNEEYKNTAGFVDKTSEANVILVADADLLADRFWVQKSSFFGQSIATPFANNGDFVANSVENLGGSSELISIRARGKFSRPFTRVNEIEVQAEAKFREKEQELQARLSETEQKLSELQSQIGEGGKLVLNQEQQQAIDSFIAEKLSIRKSLREVQHQLNKDIEALGSWLKFINVIVAPLFLTILLYFLSLAFKRRKIA
ncbi:GldG family protein [Catenovulum sediminis]|uniref:GldG family protein n=1 Tax=Catenovulum sediminis TaxID=1740262 RepID=UPI00117F5AA5|nr:Gldg family protein [Catenovulum sediminis]